MGLFGFGRRPRQYGQPPEWFSLREASYMTAADWYTYTSALAQHLVEVCDAWQCSMYTDLRDAAQHGLIGGANDGAGRYQS